MQPEDLHFRWHALFALGRLPLERTNEDCRYLGPEVCTPAHPQVTPEFLDFHSRRAAAGGAVNDFVMEDAEGAGFAEDGPPCPPAVDAAPPEQRTEERLAYRRYQELMKSLGEPIHHPEVCTVHLTLQGRRLVLERLEALQREANDLKAALQLPRWPPHRIDSTIPTGNARRKARASNVSTAKRQRVASWIPPTPTDEEVARVQREFNDDWGLDVPKHYQGSAQINGRF